MADYYSQKLDEYNRLSNGKKDFLDKISFSKKIESEDDSQACAFLMTQKKLFSQRILKNPDKKTGVVIYEKTIQPTKEYFLRIKRILKKYIDASELNYNLLTAWILGTPVHNKFETFPLLTITGRKQGGKTRTLKLLSVLTGNGSVSTSITETHLFRHKSGAIFFDEMESLSFKEKTALRETLNAVYKKGNRVVRYAEKRINGTKEYVEEEFFPFYPLGIANIYGFGDVLADRSIQIILQRSNKKQTQLIEDFSTNQEILELKEEISQLNIKIPSSIFSEWNNFIQGKKFDSSLKYFFEQVKQTEIFGRPLEIFFPLFLVAREFNFLPEILDASKEYLSILEGEALDNPDDLLQLFIEDVDYTDFIPLSTLLKDFKNSLEEPQDWMNSKWFGRALKRLGVIGAKRLINGKVQVLLNINTTNSTNTINSTNTTNSTKNNDLVELVEFVDKKELVDKNKKTLSESKIPDFTKSVGDFPDG